MDWEWSFTWDVIILNYLLFYLWFLHSECEMTIFDKDLRSKEGHAIVRETLVVAFLPLAFVEVVEVISPVKVKALSLFVVVVCLNIVVLSFPWQIVVCEASGPVWELWDP